MKSLIKSNRERKKLKERVSLFYVIQLIVRKSVDKSMFVVQYKKHVSSVIKIN